MSTEKNEGRASCKLYEIKNVLLKPSLFDKVEQVGEKCIFFNCNQVVAEVVCDFSDVKKAIYGKTDGEIIEECVEEINSALTRLKESSNRINVKPTYSHINNRLGIVVDIITPVARQ